jgi:AsmA-like C-terminal region
MNPCIAVPEVKKTFKWIAIVLSSLIAIVGLASGVAWYYKPELTQLIHEKLQENINGDFKIEDIRVSVFGDFPNVSVSLEDLYLRDHQYSTYKRDFLKAKKVLVNVSLAKLLVKEIHVTSVKIIGAEVFIFRTRNGYSNTELFKVNKPVPTDTIVRKNSGLVLIHQIILDNVKVDFQDSLKEKVFGVRFVKGENEIIQTDSSRQFHFIGKIDFDGLQFNPKKGSYLLNRSAEARLNVEFMPKSHRLLIQSSTLTLDKSTIGIAGGFQFVPDGKYFLHIGSENLDYAEGLSVLPEALTSKLSKYQAGTPVVIAVDVDGKITPGNDPSIDIRFETKDAPITIGKFEAQHVSAKGSFSNHFDSQLDFNDANSAVDISSFDGIIDGLPLTGNASFHNLIDTDVTLKLSMDTDARRIQREIDSATYQIAGGKVIATVAYAGKLNEFLDRNKIRLKGKLEGRVDLKNVKFVWAPRNFLFENVNAAIAFTQNEFLIENFAFLFNKNVVNIKGSVGGFVPFFTQPKQKGFVKLLVSSPNLNFGSFTSTAPRVVVRANQPKQKKVISNVIDDLYRKLEFDLNVNIKQLQVKNIMAKDVSGNITLTNNQLQANPIRMKLAGGDVRVSFELSDLHKSMNRLWLQANVRQADIKDFFRSFNNFNQKTVSYTNVSGKITTNVNLSTLINDELDVQMPSLSGNVELTVKDGELTDFAPLEKMSNFLFKKRDFSDVKFAEIKSSFSMRGTELTINRMEIESTVLSLFLEGRFSLADSTDLSIQIPLSNLKKRNKDYKPENVGTSSKVGPSVFLRARQDSKGVMGIGYDMFKKFRKK